MKIQNTILILALIITALMVLSAISVSASGEKAIIVTGELTENEPSDTGLYERTNVTTWFRRWGYNTWSMYTPSKSDLLAHISDPSTKYYFQYGHGAPNGITITLTGPDVGLYASDVEVCLTDRDPITFAFLFGCNCMLDTGPGTISYAFRKGSSTNTVVIGFKGLGGTGYGWGFRSVLFEKIHTGCTIKEAFDYTLTVLPHYVGIAVFTGDESLTLEYGDTLYPELVIEDVWIEDCEIHYKLENTGTGSAGPSHTQLRLLGAVVDTVTEAGLSAGAHREGAFSVTWQAEWIAIEVDCNNEVDEIDESNNYQQIFWMCGDVNGDAAVNVIDVVLTYERALNPNYPLNNEWAGDVNCDHEINVIDVMLIYERSLDPGYDLNCCCG